MGDQGPGHDPHKREHGHKKGSFLNKFFSRQGSIKFSGGGHGSCGAGNAEREEAAEGRASAPMRRSEENPYHYNRFHLPISPLGSSAPAFPSLRYLAGAGVRAAEGVRRGGDKGGGLDRGGGRRGRGEGKLNSQRLLNPLTPAAVAALKIALDYLGSTALGEEGLYRVSGNKLDVDRLKVLLAAGLLSSSDILQSHYPDKHVIAGAIKKVLQEHEPLLGYHSYADFVSVGAGSPGRLNEDEIVLEEEGEEGGPRRSQISELSNSCTSSSSSGSSSCRLSGGNSSSKEGRYRDLVLQLRPTSRELLGHLLRHLRMVAARSEENKMTAENLAVTIGLNLLRKSESVAGVSIQQLEKERAVIMDLIVLCPLLFPSDGMGGNKNGNKNKTHPPLKPFHAPRVIKSAPASRTPRYFFPLTDEVTRKTAPLSATGGGDDDRDVPVFLKPPLKPLKRLHEGTGSRNNSTTHAATTTINSHPKTSDCTGSESNSSVDDRSVCSALPRVAEARPNPLASTLPFRPPDKPERTSPRRASWNESSAFSLLALSVSSCSLSAEGNGETVANGQSRAV